MKTKETRIKLSASAAALCITALCVLIVNITPLKTTGMKITGAFASVLVISAAAWIFPVRFYLLAMMFDIFAAALGSVINLYRYVGFYDKFVHYLSGILLAEAGMILISYLFKKRSMKDDHAVKLLFSFFFSASCAGFWEIYEFTADNLIKANMQGGNNNTMGDIISGVLGALTYCLVSLAVCRGKNNDSHKSA
ncbi:MAG: hypothetical protein ACI4JA_11270 [Oscillospiraceae bacterium]